MKYFILSILITVSTSVIAERLKPADEIINWIVSLAKDKNGIITLANADINEMSIKVNSYNNGEIIEIVRSVKNFPFSEQFVLMGFVASNNHFGLIVNDCLDTAIDIEKAVCLGALNQWKASRGLGLSSAEKNSAIHLLDSENKLARRLIVMTVLSIDPYNVSAIKIALEIVEMDLSNQLFGNDVKDGFIQILEIITDTNTGNMNKASRVSHFRKWVRANKDLNLQKSKKSVVTE